MKTIENSRLNLVSNILIAIIFSLFLNTGTANAEHKAEALSISTIDSQLKIPDADVIWNGIEYKVVYSIDDSARSARRKIYWATVDIEGNIIETVSLIDNPHYSAENPTLIYTGIDYILLWVQTIPASGFCRLRASTIDKYGNMIHDKIISEYVTKGPDPIKDPPGIYTASWDDAEETLYVVYAEGNPRYKNTKKGSSPIPERLVFSKLYRVNDKLYFLKRERISAPQITAYMKIYMINIGSYLEVITYTNLDSFKHLILLNLNGERAEEDISNMPIGQLNEFLTDKLTDMVDEAHRDLLRLSNVVTTAAAMETSNVSGDGLSDMNSTIDTDHPNKDALNAIAEDNGYASWNDMVNEFNKFDMGRSMGGLTAGSPIAIQAIQSEIQTIVDAVTSSAKTKESIEKKIGQLLLQQNDGSSEGGKDDDDDDDDKE